jgi:uncharacterized protein YgiM (DUF1202 family)
MGYNIFAPIDGIAHGIGNWLWSLVRRNPLRALKILAPILLIFFVIGKCSSVPEKEKAAQQTQTRTQTAQQVQQYAYVNSDALNMRNSPSTEAAIVTVLHKNDKVQFIENSGNSANWSKIRFGNHEGFVNSSFLRQ